jgi:hypothetical protein
MWPALAIIAGIVALACGSGSDPTPTQAFVTPSGPPTATLALSPLATSTLTPTSAPEPTPKVTEPADPNAAVHGRWEGANTIGVLQLGFLVSFDTVDGNLTGKMDVPDQGLFDVLGFPT